MGEIKTYTMLVRMYKGIGNVPSSCFGAIGDRSELHDRNSAATFFVCARSSHTDEKKAFRNKIKTYKHYGEFNIWTRLRCSN